MLLLLMMIPGCYDDTSSTFFLRLLVSLKGSFLGSFFLTLELKTEGGARSFLVVVSLIFVILSPY